MFYRFFIDKVASKHYFDLNFSFTSHILALQIILKFFISFYQHY